MGTDRVEVLIVTSLKEELDAVLSQVDDEGGEWGMLQDRSGAPYYVRNLTGREGQPIRVATAWLGGSGATAATMRSRQLVDELDPAWLMMCGICAGRRGRVSLGDVIVADRVYEFDVTEKQSGELIPRYNQATYILDTALKMNAEVLASETAWLGGLLHGRPPSVESQSRWLLHALHAHESEGEPAPVERPERREKCPSWARIIAQLQDTKYVFIDRESGELRLTETGRSHVLQEKILYPDGLPGDPPFRTHVGALATAATGVIQSSLFLRLSQIERGMLGLDLESTAIGSVASHLNRRWMVVRAVTDYATFGEKDDSFRWFAARAAARFLLEFIRRHVEVRTGGVAVEDRTESEPAGPMALERLRIKGFKNIVEFELDELSRPSKLGGLWTCLAGINGSGKTAILQAIALALLGDKLTEQLGSVRLARMVRQGEGAPGQAEITATVRLGAEAQELVIPLSKEGLDSPRLSVHSNRKEMRALWEHRARREVLVAYGASRNLSEYLDNRYEPLHPEVQRQMTLFDPLARVARADLLLSEDPQVAPVIHTLRQLLGSLLTGLPIKLAADESALRFEVDGAVLPVTALPDGFRSTIAWLGDLCAAWHDKARPEDVKDGDPRHIQGIVLVDEIDLHLHPSLQRVLVPRLREAMPQVQWIVTTHSPLVLASFDRQEIKMLDSSEPGGVRQLDRDIIGFSTDQIYDWLMNTPPRGVVLEEMLRKVDEETEPAQREEVAMLVAQSPEFSAEDARKRVAWRRELIEHLRREGAGPGAPEAPAGEGDGEP